MCCVVGYVGNHNSRALVMNGLTRLEYRGYDSAGFACLNTQDQQIHSVKAVGGVDNLAQQCALNPIDGVVGVGHTRWSTHGVVTVENAHPVFDCTTSVAVVHNGIIENHTTLRTELESSGHLFKSATDSESIAHILEHEIGSSGSLRHAIAIALQRLHGAYAFVALMKAYPDMLLAVRKRSPLCIGMSEEGNFVASDPLAFAGGARQVLFMPDESFAFVYKNRYELYDFNGVRLDIAAQPLQLHWSNNDKLGYDHFMLKEIYEQKRVIEDTVLVMRSIESVLTTQLGVSRDYLSNIKHIILVGCGTSWHAAHIAKFFFESLCKIPVTVGLASEFKHRELFLIDNSLCIAISQSGETADTLEVLRLMNQHGIPTVALTNVPSSTMVREALGFLLLQAGQEVSVASTKAFTAQIAVLFWFANFIAREKELMSEQQFQQAETDLINVATTLQEGIEKYKDTINNRLAAFYARYTQAIFLGRHISYIVAQEAALKIKELAYIFAEAYPAGELKHGSLALIEEKTLVFVFSVIDPLIYQKLVSNAQEVKSRGGHIVAFAFEGQTELINLADDLFIFPVTHPLLMPLAMIGVTQYLLYKIAHVLNLPIDKPRNLAKSVTVE